MQNEQLNELAQQMVSNLKSMDDFKAMHKLMLQQFINNSLEAEMQEHRKHPTNPSYPCLKNAR